MHTERIAVAAGIELAVDTWTPGAGGRSGAQVGDSQRPDGPPGASFVLVHGLASNARMWDGVAARLVERGHPAVTVDLRGHGRSSKPDGPYDVPTVAGDLAALIATMRLDQPIVAGQSWGGNVVLELGARQPGLARGLVLVDGGWLDLRRAFPDWGACRAALAPPRLAGLHRAEIEGYVRSAHPDWPETGIQGTLANFEVRADGTVAPWLTFDRHIDVLRGLWDHHPSERYRSVPVPVLLAPADTADAADDARGERKRLDVAEALAALPQARVRWFTGDHDIHAQHPIELADVLIDFATGGLPGD